MAQKGYSFKPYLCKNLSIPFGRFYLMPQPLQDSPDAFLFTFRLKQLRRHGILSVMMLSLQESF